jgi:hypothetical protein
MPKSVDWKTLREQAVDVEALGTPAASSPSRSVRPPSQEEWDRMTSRQTWAWLKANAPQQEYRRQAKRWWLILLASLLDPPVTSEKRP